MGIYDRIVIKVTNDGYAKHSIIPKNTTEQLVIEIKDELAIYSMSNSDTTRKLVEDMQKNEYNAVYKEDLKKGFCHFPNWSKKKIFMELRENFKEIGINIPLRR